MSLTIEDLQPNKFTITLDGLELEADQPELYQIVQLQKLGYVFQNPQDHSKQQIKVASDGAVEVIGELIPQLKDKKIKIKYLLEIIGQLIAEVQPDDNKYLSDNNVKFDTDPKAEKTG